MGWRATTTQSKDEDEVLQTVSAKTLPRYVNEFAGRHNSREQDTIDQMAFIARNLVGKRLPYRELIQ